MKPYPSNTFFTEIFDSRNRRQYGIARLGLYYLPADKTWNINFETDTPSKDINCLIFEVPLSATTPHLAYNKFEFLIENSSLDGILQLYDDRICLRSGFLTGNPLGKILSEIKWITGDVNSCLMDFQPRTLGSEMTCKFLFHKDYYSISEKLHQSVMRILGKKGKEKGSAFGFCTRYGTQGILTAKHCLEDNQDSAFLKTSDNQSFSCKISKISDGKIDLAILDVPQDCPLVHGLPIGDSDLCEIGDKIYLGGYPSALGNSPTVSLGHISKIKAEYKNCSNLIQISGAAINPNNSGGPLTNFKGEVIGILTSRGLKSDNLQNIGFCEPINRIL